ncbi:type VII secretion protein EssB/YukC [Enterococcus durans]|uniref:type VII secretion protein EssB/YukC n=1 Tax=Enterococcus durans TaxID=53345 RepID=UPI001E5F49E1|nr:type VII secretion protein EssB/YukC [Enterococcus durans]
MIGTRIVQQKNKRQTENFFVKKRKYRLYKWGMVIFIFLTSCFMGIVGDYQLKRIPTLERFSQAKALFIDEDYPGVLMMLREDKIADLSESTRYVLAVSSVHVATLADKQKRGILELLSKKASDDLLLYWVYIGKGALEKALEIAKKSEDKPAILYVYTKLYDESQTKQQMESKKKQELRTEYKEAIEYYFDLVEGKFITD